MHKLHELKDMLCEELEEYGEKGKLDVGSLDVVDKLAHAIKNIDKIIMAKEDGYSERGYYPMPYSYDDMDMGTSHRYSRARKRDAMGRYSRAESDFKAELEELMHDAPNDHIKQKIRGIMSEM